MNKKSFLVYFDWEEPFSQLSNEELGELFMAMIKYARTQEEPEIERLSSKIIFSFIKTALDRDRAAYKEKCKQNSENRKKAKQENNKNKKPSIYPSMSCEELLQTLNR